MNIEDLNEDQLRELDLDWVGKGESRHIAHCDTNQTGTACFSMTSKRMR